MTQDKVAAGFSPTIAGCEPDMRFMVGGESQSSAASMP